MLRSCSQPLTAWIRPTTSKGRMLTLRQASTIASLVHKPNKLLRTVNSTHFFQPVQQSLSTRTVLGISPQKNLFVRPSQPSLTALRTLSSDAGGGDKAKPGDEKKSTTGENNEAETKEIMMTPGEKVVAASRLTMWAGIAVFAACCAYYIGKELLPTKMSPNRVFDRSYDVIRNDPEVKRRYGDQLKAYGRDHGGHREGRRNFVEHTEYVDPEDGSKRTRVRYNLTGQHGTAFVFAEVSSTMPSGEFVYILVQDKSNGRVHTVIDNRAALTAQRLAAGNKEVASAMSQLLRGGGNRS